MLDDPDRDAVQVGEPLLEAGAGARRPQIPHLERLELEGLLGGEMVFPDQGFDAGQELLVFEHEDLGVEDAGLVRAGAVHGPLLQGLDEALDVLHRRAQPTQFLLDSGARHDAMRHLRQGPAHHHRGTDRDPRRDSDALEQSLAHVSSSSFAAASAASSASVPVRCISWNPSATRASSAAIASSASSPSVLMTSVAPRAAAGSTPPMMLLRLPGGSSWGSPTALLWRRAPSTGPAAARACMPGGLTIAPARSITAIP